MHRSHRRWVPLVSCIHSSSWCILSTAHSMTPTFGMPSHMNAPPSMLSSGRPNVNAPSTPLSGIYDEQGRRTLSRDVQEEANKYFQQLYNSAVRLRPRFHVLHCPPSLQITVDNFVQKLRTFSEGSTHERDVFFCMQKNLFEVQFVYIPVFWVP